ncbi:hypothetical protein MBLNU459_g4490t1 [Dothideomycetes sp. NU459]
MSVEVAAGTPLAEALQNAVQPKLAEVGWSTGAQDDVALSEYIILMLINGKTQEQIANEIGTDLLGLGENDAAALEFAKWLFEQVHVMNAQLNGASQQDANMGSVQSADAPVANSASAAQDATMSEGTDGPAEGSIPTGPKSMRNGPQQKGRDRRMLGQLNKNMDRTGDAALHRIRGAAGAGRINTHGNAPPRGPKSMGNRAGGRGGGMAGAMGGMNPAMAQNSMMNVNPQQQMQLLKMLEEQSRMMAQILGPGANAPAINPAFFGGQQQAQQGGKSLFDRVDKPRQNGHFNKNRQPRPAQGDAMDTDTPADGDKDPSSVPCRFQLSCTNPSCSYGHQSPAAPAGVSLDLTDKCPYGAACTNKKCVASHPSPAQKRQHLATTVDCKFYPNCTNPNCPFKHPTTPPCRNGADCPTRDTGCKFSHSDIVCRYNPCLNPSCVFKHADGQKRGAFADKVWTANGTAADEGFDRESAEKANHVSERKFVNDAMDEELILPGRDGENGARSGRTSPDTLAEGDIVT